MRKQIFLALLLLPVISIYAQKGGNYSGNTPRLGVITGKVIDKDLSKPMEYANLVLYNTADSTMVTGTITDMEGIFELKDIPYGTYYLIANFIGYDKHKVNNIKVTKQKSAISLKPIYLRQSAKGIETVDIVADRARVEYKIDRKVVNVSQDLKAAGGTASDVLENVPSVSVDIEGNVSLRGNDNFTVLIDGRPSSLDGNEALQQIPASIIENIEIITNPSAKYDPDGVSGIINIVMKKQKFSGVSGVANVSAGVNNKYRADFLLNYRTNKFNVYAGGDYNDFKFEMDGTVNQQKFTSDTLYDPLDTDTITYIDKDMERYFKRSGYSIKAGIDLFLSKKSTLSVGGRYGSYDFGGGSEVKSHSWKVPEYQEEEYYTNHNITTREREFYSLDINFTHKFNDTGHELSVRTSLRDRNGTDEEQENEYYTDSEWNRLDVEPYRINTSEEGPSKRYRASIDYTLPIGEKGRFEAGCQTRIDKNNEDYIFSEHDSATDTWIKNETYSRDMDFFRNIQGLYATYSNEYGKLGYQLGFRAEYTFREITSSKNNETYTIDRPDFFPTLHLSYQFKNDNQFLVSYSRRINRPRGWYLEPYISYMDADNLRRGNAGLKPEYVNSYELGYQKKFGTSFIAFETYYRKTTDVITRTKQLYTLEDGSSSETLFLNTYDNLNSETSIGAELMANLELLKWLSINASTNYYYYELEGTLSDDAVNRSSNNWNFRLNTTFKFTPNARLQTGVFYRGASVTAQGDEEPSVHSNIAYRHDLFKRKLSLTVQVRDIFGHKHESSSYGLGFYEYDDFNREARVVSIALSYKINNYKTKDTPDSSNSNGIDMNGSDGEY